MGLFEQFPYTNFHELNLDWILQKLKEVDGRLDDFIEEVGEDIEPLVLQLLREYMAQIFYDNVNDAVVLVPSDTVSDVPNPVENFQIGNFRYPVRDASAAQQSDLAMLPGYGQNGFLFVTPPDMPGRFHTINDAIDYAKTYAAADKRVTIVIDGAEYGHIYNEALNLDATPYIDLFGINNPVVRSSVAWRESTLYTHHAIFVYGITFENYYTPGTGEHAGYALHNDPVAGLQIFNNCIFFSDNNSAVGMGLATNGRVIFNNCRFRGASGAVYFHNNSSTASAQFVTFNSCYFEGITTPDIRVFDATNGDAVSTMFCCFMGCGARHRAVQYTYASGSNATYIPSGQSDQSLGNTNIVLLPESACPGIAGVNYGMGYREITRTACTASNTPTLAVMEVQDAYYYNFEAGSGNPVTVGAITVFATDRDRVQVFLPGMSAGSIYKINLIAKPKASV